MFKSLLKKQKRTGKYNYRLILDLGTEFLKVSLVEYAGSEVSIIGFSREKQRYGDMDGGSVASIPGVITTARQALGRAVQRTPHRPQDIVIGIAGAFVKGVSTIVERRRKLPYKCITEKEICQLVQHAQHKGLEEAREILRRETGQKKLNVRAINSAVVEVKVDGFRVNNPLKFRAGTISIRVFHTFCPLVHISALSSVARGLGLPLAGTLAEPYAVAASILNHEAYEFGALVVDIGGGTTDIALIRNGGIEGTEIFAMGGRAFTRSIASRLNVTLEKAEKIKLKYSQGRLADREKSVVKNVVQADLSIFYQGLETALTRLSRGEALPRRIYFCGGGSSLAGLMEGLEDEKIFQTLPYFENPEIVFLCGEDIKGLAGEGEIITGPENVTPAALAREGVKLGSKVNLFDDVNASLGG